MISYHRSGFYWTCRPYDGHYEVLKPTGDGGENVVMFTVGDEPTADAIATELNRLADRLDREHGDSAFVFGRRTQDEEEATPDA